MAESRIQELRDDPDEDLGFDDRGLDRYPREPAPILGILVIAATVIAILVYAMFLMSRQPQPPSSGTVQPSTSTTTPTTTPFSMTPTTAPVAETPASASPAPPAAETVTAPSANPAPVVLAPTAAPTPQQPPKLNVTRTSAAAGSVAKAPPFNGGWLPGNGWYNSHKGA